MSRVEQRLEIIPQQPDLEETIEVVKVQEIMFRLVKQLEMPELCFEKKLGTVIQLREALYTAHQHTPFIFLKNG